MYTTTAAAISLLRIYPADRPTQIAQVQGFFKVRTNLSVHQHEIKACIHTMPHYANFIKKKKKTWIIITTDLKNVRLEY